MSPRLLAACLAVVVGGGCTVVKSWFEPGPDAAASGTVVLTTGPGGVVPIPTLVSITPPPMPHTLPSSTDCARDADCEVSLAYDGTGCCTQSFAMPMSKAHRAAVDAWAKTACAGYVCPPQPFPGPEPAKCFFEPRCKKARCGNACATP